MKASLLETGLTVIGRTCAPQSSASGTSFATSTRPSTRSKTTPASGTAGRSLTKLTGGTPRRPAVTNCRGPDRLGGFRASLGKQLVRTGRECDEPGNGPPAVGLTTEYIHALFRSLVLGAIHLCRKRPGQSDDRNIANDDDLVNVGIVVVELD